MSNDLLTDKKIVALLNQQFLDLFSEWTSGGWDGNEALIKEEFVTLIKAFKSLHYGMEDILNFFYTHVIADDLSRFMVAWSYLRNPDLAPKNALEAFMLYKQFGTWYYPALTLENMREITNINLKIKNPTDDASKLEDVHMNLTIGPEVFLITKNSMLISEHRLETKLTIHSNFTECFFHAVHYFMLLALVEVCGTQQSIINLQNQNND